MAVISPPPFLESLPKSISCAQITANSLCVHGSRIFELVHVYVVCVVFGIQLL